VERLLNATNATPPEAAERLPCCGEPGAGAGCRLCLEAPAARPLSLWRRERYNGSHPDPQCSAEDKLNMNRTMKELSRLVATKGLSSVPHVLPNACAQTASRGLNYTSYGLCLQEVFEISPGCTQCHVKYVQKLAGTDVFHLGCIAKCMPIVALCKDVDLKYAPPKECLKGINTCLSCTAPPYKEVLNCVRVPTKEEGTALVDNFVQFFRQGNFTLGAFEQFHRKTQMDFHRKATGE